MGLAEEIIYTFIDKSFSIMKYTAIPSLFMMIAIIFIEKKKYKSSIIFLILFFFSSFFYKSILYWVQSLGEDSFVEARNFDVKSAIFWAQNFSYNMQQSTLQQIKYILLILLNSTLLSIVLYAIHRKVKTVKYIAYTSIAVLHVIFVYNIFNSFVSAKKVTQAIAERFKPVTTSFKAHGGIDLFIYIGESTTTMNMGVYGYPLDTTPNLSSIQKIDQGLLVFQNVRSTHSHTTFSLLRALSFPLEVGSSPSSYGIGSILQSASLNAKLYSTQPKDGSFAMLASLILGGTTVAPHPQSSASGQEPPLTAMNQDDKTLQQALQQSGVVFFHSFAGHGLYQSFTNPDLSHDVPHPDINSDGIIGLNRIRKAAAINEIKEYDRTVTYIDRNISYSIKEIKNRETPAAFIYFSDHGESVYSRRSHESSVYLNEMSTTPFIVYFNEAYARAYPTVFARYQASAKRTQQPHLLDQVTPTILDVLQVQSSAPILVPNMSEERPHPYPYIMERTTQSGTSRISMVYDPDNIRSFTDARDGSASTAISVIAQKFGDQHGICYHRSNSYAKALRAANSSNCLEVDLVVDDQLSIHHPPLPATGFTLNHVFDIIRGRQKDVWIDSKNLTSAAACNKLADFLSRRIHEARRVLVEFPDTSIEHAEELAACAHRLQSMGARTSYYLPTDSLLACAADKASSACDLIRDRVKQVTETGNFTDFSFDIGGYAAMTSTEGSRKLPWNTWGITVSQFPDIRASDFNFIILDTAFDPNTY